ncbi:MAG: endonuclease NucS, partial [Zestosphaera sp.]
SERVLYRGSPTLKELHDVIRKWFRRSTIVIIADCEVVYSGRASSKASRSWRLLIIKEDGTVLIHESTGREPVNWQPNSYVVSEIREDVLIIKALRTKPREELLVRLRCPCEVLVIKLGVGRFVLTGTEHDIVEYLTRNPGLIEEGCELIAREVATLHGRVDLVLRGEDGALIVVEVKRGVADVEAIYQLMRYVEYYKSLGMKRVRGVIVAQSLTPNTRKLIRDLGFTSRCVKVSDDEVSVDEVC